MSSPKQCCNQNGFALIVELLVVAIVLVGIATAAVIVKQSQDHKALLAAEHKVSTNKSSITNQAVKPVQPVQVTTKTSAPTTTSSKSTATTTKPTTTTPTKPSSTAQPTNQYAGWQTGSISSEGLTFYYPSGWTLSNVADSDYLAQLQLKNGYFVITIDALKPGSSASYGGGMGGAITYNTTVGQSVIDGHTVYLLDTLDSSDHEYIATELSGCNGAKKCLFTSPATGNYIEASIDYQIPGYQAPVEFSPSSATYLQAVQIVKSISIQ